MKTFSQFVSEALNENFASDIVKHAQDLEITKPYTWDDIQNLAEWAEEENLPRDVQKFIDAVVDEDSKYRMFIDDGSVVLPKGTQLFYKNATDNYIIWEVSFKGETYGCIMVAGDMVDELKDVTKKLG